MQENGQHKFALALWQRRFAPHISWDVFLFSQPLFPKAEDKRKMVGKQNCTAGKPWILPGPCSGGLACGWGQPDHLAVTRASVLVTFTSSSGSPLCMRFPNREIFILILCTTYTSYAVGAHRFGHLLGESYIVSHCRSTTRSLDNNQSVH